MCVCDRLCKCTHVEEGKIVCVRESKNAHMYLGMYSIDIPTKREIELLENFVIDPV